MSLFPVSYLYICGCVVCKSMARSVCVKSLSSLKSFNFVKYAIVIYLQFGCYDDFSIFPFGYIDFISEWVYYVCDISERI